MSRHHGYLTFVGGEVLGRSLTSAFAFSREWCTNLADFNSRAYAVSSPPQVASAFVLQHLLNIPAHVAAFAAVTGPWLVELGTLDDSRVSCDLAPGLYPERLGFVSVNPASPDLEERINAARTAYTVLGREIADAYETGVKMSSRQRFGMVDDLWEMALREARGSIGQVMGPAVERASCCFIFALPGCSECAGCPRLSAPTTQ